ncbi:helix-turn-helix transcriptional regulator [Paenibacillus mesophilus]|uniref:helix-turn-helix domain-containing protein n=1 Tax=Paenibacillus mesophilus TaxID=2582849 RepID=UPI00110D909B|nr:helix-turn-helix domain-containing protein [Paenibacillus mesophilus]TMV47388.1 helix-turn-helix transcriptional regulator [Paenibacillus mesophilus]
MLPKMRMIANKGLLQIFFALLLVAIIMFVSNYMVYRNSISGIYNQVSENNKLVVKNMIRAFDDSFKNINDIIYTIQMLSYNAWKTGDGNADMADAYMTYSNLRSLVSSIDYVEEVIVFHMGSDLAITTSGTMQLPDLLRKKFVNPSYNSEFWKTLAKTKHPLKVFPAEAYTDDSPVGVSRKLIPIIGSNQISELNVLVFLNYDKMLRHVNQESMMKGTSLMVMDQDRNMILNTEDKWNLVDMLYDLNLGTNQEETLKNKDFEYNVFKSDYNGFMYIHKAPYQFSGMESVTGVNRQIMMIAIACAVILSALLSLYLYRPVRTLVKLIGIRDAKGADYRQIRSGIAKMQEENESFKTQMDVFRAEMRKAAFQNALLGIASPKETEQRMQRYFAEFAQSGYFVLAEFRLREKNGEETANPPGLEEIAASIQQGLQSTREHVFVFPTGGGKCYVHIGARRPADREPIVKQLRAFVKQAGEEWEGVSTEVAVSRIYAAESANCHKAYRDLTDCFEYRNIDSDDPIIDFQTIRYTWNVYAPLDEIEKASRFLVIGNVEECVKIVEHIFARNEERHIHRYQLVSVAKTMLYDMLKHLDAGDAEPKQIVALEASFHEETEAAADSGDIRDALIRSIRTIGETGGKSAQKSKLDPSSIARYIEEHYRDDLHLDHMAEKLETSPKYFSNYFKKTFGINFIEYLNRVRLAQAKELLKQTELSVAEIGERTGYQNSSTFTSTFKKYYGISPSDYRKNS